MAELVLSEESLNRYGTRILTKGIKLDSFAKNPVMFYNHDRTKLPIGKWESVKKTDGKLTATPAFDVGDEFAKEVKRKFEEGYINSASIGILVLGTSNEPELMLQGQTIPTITKCELLEASIVDIPANANAVKLYHKSTNGEILELSVSDLASFENLDDMHIIDEKLQSLKSELQADLQALKAEILGFLEKEINQTPTLSAKAIVEALQASESEKHGKRSALLAKLSAHPERKFSDWWLLDNAFLRELKAELPEKYRELSGDY